MKKKFKDTKIAEFLKNKAPGILNVVGNVLPTNGAFGIIKNLITKDLSLSSKDKDTAMKIIDQDIAEMKEVSDRWATDMKSDSWLAKNVRPLTLVFLVISTVLLIFIDAGAINFVVEDKWTDLLQLVLITVIGAYFGGRSLEKIKK